VTHRSDRHTGTRRRVFALAAATLVTAALPVGCGSDVLMTGPPESVKLKPEQIYRWEGKGRGKRKTGLDPHERKKMRRAMYAGKEYVPES
jgi:hypothetical protein